LAVDEMKNPKKTEK